MRLCAMVGSQSVVIRTYSCVPTTNVHPPSAVVGVVRRVEAATTTTIPDPPVVLDEGDRVRECHIGKRNESK